jgi:hypothetical protein
MLNLGPFSLAEQEIGFKPEIGLETKIYFAPEVARLLGGFRASAAAAGTYETAGGPQIPADGREVVAVVSGPQGAVGVGAMTLTFDVTLVGDISDTATADFTVPSYSPINGNVWGFGVARDLVPDTPANEGVLIKSIDGFSACANLASGIRFDLYSVPNLADYFFIGNTMNKDLPSDIPTQVAIPEDRDPAAYVKTGRGEIPQASIGFRYKGITEQLTRFNGVPGTLRADIDKEGVLVWERHLFTGFRPSINVPRADGNEEVVGTASGIYRTFMSGYGLGA